MARSLPLALPILVLASLGLAGCLNSAEAQCFLVPWPSEHQAATYFTHYHLTDSYVNSSFVIGDRVLAIRGDGQIVAAMELNPGVVPAFVSRADNDLVGFEFGGTKGLSLNELTDWARGPALWGQCVSEGQRLEKPYKDSSFRLTAQVVSISPEALVVDFKTPLVPNVLGGVDGGLSYRSRWLPNNPLASKIIVYNETSPLTDPITTITLGRHQILAADLVEPGGRDPPPAIHMSKSTAKCYDGSRRHPALDPFPAYVTYGRYAANMSADAALQEFLEEHEKACSVLSSYEIVAEPDSTAYVWTSIFADDGNEQYLKRFAVRCFDDPGLIVVFGDCPEYNYYDIDEETGVRNGAPVNPDEVNHDIGAAEAIENIERVIDRNITRFVWRAQGPGNPSVPLAPTTGTKPGAAFEFDYGTLSRHVEYLTYRGPRVGGGESHSIYATIWPNGWIASLDMRLLE